MELIRTFVGCVLYICTVPYLSTLLLGPQVCQSVSSVHPSLGPEVQTLCVHVPLEVLASLIHSALESEACVMRAGDFPTLAVGTCHGLDLDLESSKSLCPHLQRS